MAGGYGLQLTIGPDKDFSNFVDVVMHLILLVILSFMKRCCRDRIGMRVARSLLLQVGIRCSEPGPYS